MAWMQSDDGRRSLDGEELAECVSSNDLFLPIEGKLTVGMPVTVVVRSFSSSSRERVALDEVDVCSDGMIADANELLFAQRKYCDILVRVDESLTAGGTFPVTGGKHKDESFWAWVLSALLVDYRST